MNKRCRRCHADLIPGMNWKLSGQKKKDYICKVCRRADSTKEKQVIKRETMEAYGGKCICCGESEITFLTIDHIDGAGAAERREFDIGAGHAFYYWLKKKGYPKDNYQVLCFNCNCAKHILGKCPHQD